MVCGLHGRQTMYVQYFHLISSLVQQIWLYFWFGGKFHYFREKVKKPGTGSWVVCIGYWFYVAFHFTSTLSMHVRWHHGERKMFSCSLAVCTSSSIQEGEKRKEIRTERIGDLKQEKTLLNTNHSFITSLLFAYDKPMRSAYPCFQCPKTTVEQQAMPSLSVKDRQPQCQTCRATGS